MTIKELQAAYTAADTAFTAAHAALSQLIQQWATADRLVSTAGYDVDPLAIAKARRDMEIITRAAPEAEQRVRRAAEARHQAELDLHAAQAEVQRALLSLDMINNPNEATIERYGVRQIRAEEQRLQALVRQLGG